MIRTLNYIIEPQHQGKSIGLFLKEKEYSRAVLIELKKTKTGIMKNGTWACVNEILNTGDFLEIALNTQETSENIVPQKGELEIVYEDEDILVVNKPYDTPIHPSVNHYENTLANYVMYYYEAQNKPYVFRCMNRLDRDTTGITILAKNLLSAGILSNRVTERKISRTYIAFVEGITEAEGCIDLPIGRAEDSIIKRKVDEKEGKPAVTHYRRLEVIEREGSPISIIALKLETGRTHQIRVHLSHGGHGLLGDFLYNETNHLLTRQALHSVEVSLEHPITGEAMRLTAPLPKDMAKLLEGLVDEKVLFKKLQAIKW